MYDGVTVRRLRVDERSGGGFDAAKLSLGVRVPVVFGAAGLCWLAIFAVGYALL